MTQIQGGDNPGNTVHVDDEGKMQTRSVGITEQASKSLVGDSFNLNTKKITLTDDNETVLFTFKNTLEDRPMIVTRVFLVFLVSTGGTGSVEGHIQSGVSGGTILDQALIEPRNFNFGLSKIPGSEFRIGGTGLTFTGGEEEVDFLFTSDNQRQLIPFDAITLPRGASMTLTLKPPTGNTSMMVEAGANIYIDGDF